MGPLRGGVGGIDACSRRASGRTCKRGDRGSRMSEGTTNSSLPRIGVVVIGRNEGGRLRACLASVLTMNYPASLLDVIYVDSSSTDGSVALAESMGVRTIVLEGPTTAARGRNAGWTATDAPFILFL